MPKSSKLQVIGAKIEAVQNTPIALAATDYFLCESAEVNPVPELLPRDYKRASASQLASIMGKLYKEVKIKVALKGGTGLGVMYAPHSALLQACGLIETINAGVSVVYAFASAAITNFFGFSKSCTIEVYEAGPAPIKHVIAGCVAKSAKITAKAGGFLFLEATFQGLYAAPTDTAFPAVTLAETIKEPILQSSTLLVHTFAAICSGIEIDFGLETTLREDANSGYGVKGFAILGRKVMGSLDPEVENIATHDFFGKMLSRIEAALAFNVNGAAAGNRFAFSLPKVQYNDVSYGERGAIKTFKLPYQANQNAGDDELSVTVT
jgi:hypothetical protein